MAWQDYEFEKSEKRAARPTQYQKDRSFVHGIIIGGICSAIVFGVTFSFIYGNLAKACGVG